MENSKGVFIGLIAAATAGVIIGMLIAPEKGQDLRKNIRASAEDWAKKLGNLVEEGKEQLNSLQASLSKTVNDQTNTHI